MRWWWACLLILVDLSAETAGERMAGWVSDAACGAEHTKPGGEDCVRKCIRGGEQINPDWKPQKMILVADDGKARWTVENPASLAGLEGKHVRVTAELHKESILILSAEIIQETAK
jgi:hypothetical protein